MIKTIDISLSDLEDMREGALKSVIEHVADLWVGSDESRRKHPRCGTAYISNNNYGLGELRIVFRFPFDMENLKYSQEGCEEEEEVLLNVHTRTIT